MSPMENQSPPTIESIVPNRGKTETFTVRQLMRLTGVSRTTIQYYRRKEILPPPVGTSRRYARYDYRHYHILTAIARRRAESIDLRQIAEDVCQ